MALKSVANAAPNAPSASSDNRHALWLSGGDVLEISPYRGRYGFPADPKHIPALNKMIQDLARAARAIVYSAGNDDSNDSDFLMQPIEGVVDTIILLSQLSDAVHHELAVADARAKA